MSEHDHPRGWFDPEWVLAETSTICDDGSVERFWEWVRREDWLRDLAKPTSPPPNLSTTEGES